MISNFQSYYSVHQDIVIGDTKPLLKLQFNSLYSLGYIPIQTLPLQNNLVSRREDVEEFDPG